MTVFLHLPVGFFFGGGAVSDIGWYSDILGTISDIGWQSDIFGDGLLYRLALRHFGDCL